MLCLNKKWSKEPKKSTTLTLVVFAQINLQSRITKYSPVDRTSRLSSENVI
jgi:hypothetical protein